MKCKKCKRELEIDLMNSDLINGVLFVLCPCGEESLDVDIANKVTLEKLYWRNKED